MADQTVADAIRQRRVLTFTYEGHERRVVPAALGWFEGRAVLHAYQTGGDSKRGGLPCWRNFYTDRMTGVALTDETFAADPPGFQPRNHLGSDGDGYLSIAADTAPRPGSGSESSGGTSQLPNIPPEVGKVVGDVLGAVGKWFKKRGS